MAFTSKHCCGWTILGNFWKTLGYISRSNEWQMGWTSNLKILTRLVWRDGETARVLTICNNVRYWGNVFVPEIEKRLFRFEIESHFSISNLRKKKVETYDVERFEGIWLSRILDVISLKCRVDWKEPNFPRGAAIAQRIYLHLPSCRPGVESQAYHLNLCYAPF